MKKILLLCGLMMIHFLFLGHAETDSNSLFRAANDAYRNGQFEKAYEGYEKASHDLNISELYYNLGNAAFKMHKLGLAILNYERAKRLDPRNADILENLKYAESLVEYRVENKRNWYWDKFLETLEFVRLNECMIFLSVIYFILALSLLVTRLLKKRFVFGRMGSALLSIFVILAVPTLIKFYGEKLQKNAVVIAQKVDARYGPSRVDKLAFSLVEGIQVEIADQVEDWYRVTLLSGESGWAPKEGIEIV